MESKNAILVAFKGAVCCGSGAPGASLTDTPSGQSGGAVATLAGIASGAPERKI